MEMTEDEYEAFVKRVQHQEEEREVTERLQGDLKVFISYSHSDDATARRLTDLFDELDMSERYIIDKKEIEWADDIRDFARQQINQCTHYLLILSEASAKSKWCALEFGIALGAKKAILLFLTSATLQVPAYAANYLATSDIRDVRRYFTRDLIRPEAVEKFVVQLIDDASAKLGDFKRIDAYEKECMRWEAPDRAAIESKQRDIISVYIDDYQVEEDWRLVFIELRSPFDKTAVTFNYRRPGSKPVNYEVNYQTELNGIMVRPKKHRSEIIGVRLTDDKGTDYFVDRSPSVAESLALRDVHGWSASRWFWEKAFTFLRGQLPGSRDGAPGEVSVDFKDDGLSRG